MANARGRIITRVFNGEKLLGRKTIYVRGSFRFQVLAAAKVLSIISGYKDVFNEASRATVELDGVDPSDIGIFRAFVKNYSPIPVDIIIIERKIT